MKNGDLVALLGALSCTAVLGAPAKAESFSSSDSKHGSFHFRSTASYVEDYARFAKFEWLSSNTIQPDTTVDRIIVSLADQRLYAYHDQQLLAWSNISSGRPGHETPTGAFTVSEKDVDHHSSLYENASMPFFMRLTDDGLGLHAGLLPGYPASHGCVRMPFGMARELYQRVESGTPVKITPDPVGMNSPTGKLGTALSQL